MCPPCDENPPPNYSSSAGHPDHPCDPNDIRPCGFVNDLTGVTNPIIRILSVNCGEACVNMGEPQAPEYWAASGNMGGGGPLLFGDCVITAIQIARSPDRIIITFGDGTTLTAFFSEGIAVFGEDPCGCGFRAYIYNPAACETSGSSEVPGDCCGLTPSDTLFATVSAPSCPGIDGMVIPLTWNGTDWDTGTVTTDDCTDITITVSCVGQSVTGTFAAQAETVVCDFPEPTSEVVSVQCSPFQLVMQGNCVYRDILGDICCDASVIPITVTVTL